MLDSAYSLNDRVFFDNIGTILLYAVLGTLMNFFLIGKFIYILVDGCEKYKRKILGKVIHARNFFLGPTLYGLSAIGAMGSLNLGFVQALVFASIIVAVDPVAVS